MRVSGDVVMLLQRALSDMRTEPPPPPTTPPPSPPPAQMPGAPTHSVSMLVAMAAAMPAGDGSRRERALRRAAGGIDLLGDLHAARLAGADEAGAMSSLRAWLAEAEGPAEPALAQLLRDIEVRVQVELARHERIA